MLTGIPCFSQSSTDTTYTMSVRDFDRVIYLAAKGRYADSVVNASLAALEALRTTIGDRDKVIVLQASELENLQAVIRNLEEQDIIKQDIFVIEKGKLKNQVRKLRRIIFAESAGIVALIALVLLL